jgi:hypothetical protein
MQYTPEVLCSKVMETFRIAWRESRLSKACRGWLFSLGFTEWAKLVDLLYLPTNLSIFRLDIKLALANTFRGFWLL